MVVVGWVGGGGGGHAARHPPAQRPLCPTAVASLLSMQGALAADAATANLFAAGGGGAGAGGMPAALEPTMTIATKGAFEALNRMFKVNPQRV